jgi:hypothetical protein
MTEKISDALIDAMLAGLDGVTPGPYFQTGAPWFCDGTGVLAGSPDGNIAYIIADTDDGFNPRDEYEGFALGDKEKDAAHFARCSPETIRALLLELRAYRTAANPLQEVLGKFAGAKVKPLEWCLYREFDNRFWRAEDPLGGFAFIRVHTEDAEGQSSWASETFQTAKEAKAAFEARRSDRILSALESTPAPVSEITEEMVEALRDGAEGVCQKLEGENTSVTIFDQEKLRAALNAFTVAVGGE